MSEKLVFSENAAKISRFSALLSVRRMHFFCKCLICQDLRKTIFNKQCCRKFLNINDLRQSSPKNCISRTQSVSKKRCFSREIAAKPLAFRTSSQTESASLCRAREVCQEEVGTTPIQLLPTREKGEADSPLQTPSELRTKMSRIAREGWAEPRTKR